MLSRSILTCFTAASRHNGILPTRKLRLCFSRVDLKRRTFTRSIRPYSISCYDVTSDTIYALASGHGKCGIAVIRLSGPSASLVLKELTGRQQLPIPRQASIRRLHDSVSGEHVDRALLLWFPGPNSFTGEDVCEFHIHGGIAVISALYHALDNIPGVRPAEPGEFTKRAFLNGKLDLTEVEGLGDLIHAETEAQRKQALRQMEGELSKLYKDWKDRLVKCAANIEAYIDFSEDDNIEDGVLEDANNSVKLVKDEISEHLSDNRRGEMLRSGVHVAIAGPPNAGKSSLFNAICQRPAAIVSPIAGTTRDIVEVSLNIGGYPIILSDTAGLRDTTDTIEIEGVKRARLRSQQADIIVLVMDASELIHGKEEIIENKIQQLFYPANKEKGNSVAEGGKDASWMKDTIIVFNKIDQITSGRLLHNISHFENCAISCINETNLDMFLQLLEKKVKEICGNPSIGSPSLTQTRHRSHLTACHTALARFAEYQDLVIMAEQLRIALRELGKITGRVGAEEILNVIFKDFCIGK